jgi:hypothetical protein
MSRMPFNCLGVKLPARCLRTCCGAYQSATDIGREPDIGYFAIFNDFFCQISECK